MTQRNGPALHSRRRVAVLLATLLVVALGTGVVWSWSPAPPPTPPPAPATSLAHEAAAGEMETTTSEAARPESVERSEAATRSAVVGRALDSGGAPLAGFRVTLQRTGFQPYDRRGPLLRLDRTEQRDRYPPEQTYSDATGAFAFESLDAGNYHCHISDLEQPAEEFALATGEVRELTLQSPLVALTGQLFRRGEVVKDCIVVFKDDKQSRTLHPDTGVMRLKDGKPSRSLPPNDTGVMRLFAAPGRYEVSVHLMPGVHQSRTRGPCLSRHVLLVPDGVPALRWSFEAGGTQIVFAVEDPDGRAIDTYAAEIAGTGELDQEPARYELRGARGKPASMALPAGRWRATVTADGFRLEPRDFVTGLDGREVLSFVAQPAATVRLRLRPLRRFFVAPDAGNMPALVVDGCGVPCKHTLAALRAGSAHAFEYCAVPPGKATLCFQDRIDGDELVPLPFEPVEPVTIDVALGSANEVTVDVEPRVFVDLRGCDASGMEISTAVLTVWVDGRRARNRDAVTSQRWLGWLPRGVHRVVVDRSGTSREHVLRVDRTSVRERYRP